MKYLQFHILIILIKHMLNLRRLDANQDGLLYIAIVVIKYVIKIVKVKMKVGILLNMDVILYQQLAINVQTVHVKIQVIDSKTHI